MAKTEVILTHNIVGLGGESDQVRVAAGYARNYLFPQRLAVPLTRPTSASIEALKQRRAEREAHEFNTMTELSKGALQAHLRHQGQDGRGRQDVRLRDRRHDRRRIEAPVRHHARQEENPSRTPHPRARGEYEVELNLHAEVKGTLKVRVESLTAFWFPRANTSQC
jgi:large subunit ribosomal protein L9